MHEAAEGATLAPMSEVRSNGSDYSGAASSMSSLCVMLNRLSDGQERPAVISTELPGCGRLLLIGVDDDPVCVESSVLPYSRRNSGRNVGRQAQTIPTDCSIWDQLDDARVLNVGSFPVWYMKLTMRRIEAMQTLGMLVPTFQISHDQIAYTWEKMRKKK